MKIKVLILLLVFTVPAVSAQKKIEFVYPKVPFDSEMAAKQLDHKGTSTIKGTAMINNKPVGYYVKVFLFPMTPYLEEYLALENKLGLKEKKRASMSPLALSYRLISKCEDAETFEFTNLKPGKYYIESYVTKTKEKKGAYLVGQEAITFEGSYISGPPIFQEYTYNKSRQYHMSGIAEITSDGQTVDVTIKN
ncbi:hypothetical protein [Aequorivita antarctica]|uniref:Carboxypeptidase regulatory-like domain-containing protein n=1 Tax=Aequorivita antarctica TaxID=153266 RepID=A0A5C6Z1L0_9FLAO|nr:hypothetical protein [Aequorivita antarctica]TXD73268.1 hypothetical protein ESU54_09015 [Aequorivita antarctica]SRX76021.1 hypothetical protein AEQU3_03019 [Aequorivita antarctica]